MMLERTSLIMSLCRGEIFSWDFAGPREDEEPSLDFSQYLGEEEISCERFLTLFREQSSLASQCRLYRDLGRVSLTKAAEFLLHQTACGLLSANNVNHTADGRVAMALTEDPLSSEWGTLGLSVVEEGGDFLLAGEKKRVLFAEEAKSFLVLALDPKKNTASLFYVPSNLPGLTILKDSSGGTTSLLKFDDVRISSKNRVGEVGDGRQTFIPFETRARLFWAAASLGAAKRCLDQGLCASERNKRFTKPLAELSDVKKALGRARVQIKTLESVIRVTASLGENDHTIHLEAIAAKLLADETFQILGTLFDDLGGLEHLEPELWPNRMLENAFSGSLFGSRLFLNEVMTLSATRDRLEFAKKRGLLERFKRMVSHPRLKKVSSQFSKESQRLSEMIQILGHVSGKLLKVYGENFVNECAQHERFSSMITDTFAALSLLLCADADDSSEHLAVAEGVELIWEHFVKRSGELYTTKHDDELASIGGALLSLSEED